MEKGLPGWTKLRSPGIVEGSDESHLGRNGSQQGLLMRKMAIDRAGRPVVVNSTFREGACSHIWLHAGEFE